MLFLQLKVQKFVSRHMTVLALIYFSTDKHFHISIENNTHRRNNERNKVLQCC